MPEEEASAGGHDLRPIRVQREGDLIGQQNVEEKSSSSSSSSSSSEQAVRHLQPRHFYNPATAQQPRGATHSPKFDQSIYKNRTATHSTLPATHSTLPATHGTRSATGRTISSSPPGLPSVLRRLVTTPSSTSTKDTSHSYRHASDLPSLLSSTFPPLERGHGTPGNAEGHKRTSRSRGLRVFTRGWGGCD